MAEIIKHINDTNASYRSLTAGDAKNTDLFFDQSHYGFFGGINRAIKVRLHKTNLSQSILFIASILPRKYDLGTKHYRVDYSSKFVEENLSIIDAFFTVDGAKTEARIVEWNVRKDIVQKNGKIDDRLYLNGLQFDLPYTFNGAELVAKFSIRNYLAGGYSNVRMVSNDDDVYDLYISNTTEAYCEKDGIVDEKDNYSDEIIKNLQVIYYGAPGTGKSNKIKGIINTENTIRTTFHPDSDYSTFVGCYKPIKPKVSKQEILDYDKLVEKYKKYISDLGNVTHASAIIGYNYHDSIVKMVEDGSHTIVQLVVDAYKSNTTYDTMIRSGMLLYEESQPIKGSDTQITYKFVPQAFTKAYIEAWKTEKEVYLIIEEINRGNCAQIFGDLFQLLDRKNGISEYPVDADTDLENYLSEKLANTQRVDIPQEVKEGKKLMLPSNLYIWATMNTSDQSLFPIDSAFKRRWDWRYIPIKEGDKNYKIEVGNATYDWWKFIEIVNARIEDVTDSEDKQIGYWFAKPHKDNIISAETLVSKVIFYLWNDVFKDYAHSTSSLFHTEKHKYKFREFYNDNGNVKIELLNEFMLGLGLENETPQSEENQQVEE